jgi:hypothetical protein
MYNIMFSIYIVNNIKVDIANESNKDNKALNGLSNLSGSYLLSSVLIT